MKLRVKNTPFTGEVIGDSGTVDNPTVTLLMKNGTTVSYTSSELTEVSIIDIVWTVFNKNGNRKNQIVFISSIISIILLCILN